MLVFRCGCGLERRATATLKVLVQRVRLGLLKVLMDVQMRCPDHDRATPDEESQHTCNQSLCASNHVGEAKGWCGERQRWRVRRGSGYPSRHLMTRFLPAFLLALTLLHAPALAAQRLLPDAWYNDPGGLTLGVQLRGNASERGERHTLRLGWSTGLFSPRDQPIKTLQASLTLENPLRLSALDLEQRIDLFRLDGRSGASASIGQRERFGASLRWLAVHDDRFLDAERWDVGGTLEAPIWLERRGQVGTWQTRARGTLTGAVEYRRPGDGITTPKRYDMQPWARAELEVTAQRVITGAVSLGVRASHASLMSADPILPQRRLFVAGADPYEQMNNPFLRAVGAPLVRGEMAGHWHAAGGGNLRGFDAAIASNHRTAVNIEVVATVVQRSTAWLSRIALVAFADAARLGEARGIGGDAGSLVLRAPLRRTLIDAGVGVRMRHSILGVAFESRVELPFYVNDAAWASTERTERVSLSRWLVGIAPVIL